jgi:PAS domain S-box-containing protein
VTQNAVIQKSVAASGESAESEFDCLFGNTLSPMIVAGFDGSVKRVNLAFERLAGLTAGDLQAQPILGFVHPDEREAAGMALGNMVVDSISRGMVVRIRCRNGTSKWTEWTGTVSRERQVIYLIGKDITTRRNAQEALAARLQADKDLERFFSCAPDVMFVCNYDGFVTRLNAAFEALTGFTGEQLMADRIVNFAHPDDRERAAAEIQNVIAGKVVRDLEVRIRCADGLYKRVIWNATNFADLQVFYAVGADVTARRVAEQELDRFFNNSPDLMVIAGFDGQVRRINQAIGRAGYLSPEQVKSQPLINFIHPDDRPRFTSEFQKLLVEGKTPSFEMRTVMQDGSYNWFMWSATAFPDRQVFCATGHNVNDRHVAAEERQKFVSLVENSSDFIAIPPNGIESCTTRSSHKS